MELAYFIKLVIDEQMLHLGTGHELTLNHLKVIIERAQELRDKAEAESNNFDFGPM